MISEIDLAALGRHGAILAFFCVYSFAHFQRQCTVGTPAELTIIRPIKHAAMVNSKYQENMPLFSTSRNNHTRELCENRLINQTYLLINDDKTASFFISEANM